MKPIRALQPTTASLKLGQQAFDVLAIIAVIKQQPYQAQPNPIYGVMDHIHVRKQW